jgi:hypothetical protein
MSIKLALVIGAALVAAFIGVDIYLAADSVKGNTWSEIIRTWAKYTPVIPWFLGVLMGHFFHPIDNFRAVLGQPSSIALLVWLTAVVGIVGLGMMKAGHPIPGWSILVPAFAAGWLLWPV